MLVPQHILEMVEELGKVQGKVLKVVLGIYPKTYRLWENLGSGQTRAYGPTMDAEELYTMLRANLALTNGNGHHAAPEDDDEEVISSEGLSEPR